MKKNSKKKRKRYDASFTMRFDGFTLDMLERMSYDEDKTRPEIIRSAIKYLFMKKYNPEELEKLRRNHRTNNSHAAKVKEDNS